MLSKIAFTYFDDQYSPDLGSKMIKFCANGRSPEAFAAEENLSPEIFAYWARVYPEFEICLHIAFWKSFAWWEYNAMTNPDINGAVYKSVMLNRFKWKDGNEEVQRVVKFMSDQELEDLARRLLAQNNNQLAQEVVQEAEEEEDE